MCVPRNAQFIEDIREGVFIQHTMESMLFDPTGKQLMAEAVYLYGVMLTLMDCKIDGAVRERILVAYYRVKVRTHDATFETKVLQAGLADILDTLNFWGGCNDALHRGRTRTQTWTRSASYANEPGFLLKVQRFRHTIRKGISHDFRYPRMS